MDIDNGEGEQNEEAVDIDDIDNNKDDNINIFATGKYIVHNEEDTVHKVRSYDLSISYDFYY